MKGFYKKWRFIILIQTILFVQISISPTIADFSIVGVENGDQFTFEVVKVNLYHYSNFHGTEEESTKTEMKYDTLEGASLINGSKDLTMSANDKFTISVVNQSYIDKQNNRFRLNMSISIEGRIANFSGYLDLYNGYIISTSWEDHRLQIEKKNEDAKERAEIFDNVITENYKIYDQDGIFGYTRSWQLIGDDLTIYTEAEDIRFNKTTGVLLYRSLIETIAKDDTNLQIENENEIVIQQVGFNTNQGGIADGETINGIILTDLFAVFAIFIFIRLKYLQKFK